MNSSRKIAIIAGVLFIIATVAALLSTVFTKPILDATDYLIKISANENRIAIGALFRFIAAAASAGIAISLYPILKKYNQGLALGSVGFRIIEGMLGIVSVICLLLLTTLSQQFVTAGALDSSYFQNTGVLIKAVRDWMGNVAGLLAFGLGALMYYYIFFQTKLVPRWLSGWGLIGIILIIVTSMLVMFRVVGPMSTTQVVLAVPIGLQEMVLAVWLIVKGFNPSVIDSGSGETDANQV
jgi:Domain of unknown function (DUF4386)